jgi:hypothetical protein
LLFEQVDAEIDIISEKERLKAVLLYYDAERVKQEKEYELKLK